MRFIVWALVGVVGGWVIGRIMSYDKRGKVADVAAGVAGALVGGFVAAVMHPVVASAATYNGFAALLGALVLPILIVILRDSRTTRKDSC